MLSGRVIEEFERTDDAQTDDLCDVIQVIDLFSEFERTGDAAAFVAELSFDEKITVHAILKGLTDLSRNESDVIHRKIS